MAFSIQCPLCHNIMRVSGESYITCKNPQCRAGLWYSEKEGRVTKSRPK